MEAAWGTTPPTLGILQVPLNPASSTDQEVPITSQRAEKSQLRREGILRVMEDEFPLQQTADHCSDPLPSSEDTKNVT